MSRLKQYLSAQSTVSSEEHEDAPDTLPAITPVEHVSDDEYVDAQDALDEVVEERQMAEDEAAEYDAVVDDAVTMVDSLENFIEVLTYGIENSDYSAQFAGMAGTELQRVNQLLGREPEATPAFENYDQEHLNEFYEASLEGFKDAVASVKKSMANAFTSTVKYVGEINTNEKAAKALDVRANALQAKTSGFEGKRVVKLAGLGKTFTTGGQAPTNLIQAITADMKALNTLSTKYIKASVDYYAMTVNAVALAVNNPKQQDDIVKKLVGEKTPAEVVGNQTLLGRKLMIGERPTSRLNSALVEELMERLSDESAVFDKLGKAEGTLELGKADIEGLIKAAKGYSALLNTLNKEAKKELDRQVKMDKDVAEAAKNTGTGETASYSPTLSGGAAGAVVGAAIVTGAPIALTAIAAIGVGSLTALYTSRTGGSITTNDPDRTARALASLMREASGLPKESFKSIAGQVESNARACLQLAERALATKALDADPAREAANVEG